jgi:hypothetical protein
MRLGTRIIFLPVGGILYLTWTETGTTQVFFLLVNNPMGTQYFTIAMILDYEQMKICLFYDINYDLFWL